MGATSPELRADTLLYLKARAWAAPAVLLVTAANGAYRGFLDTRTPLWVALGLNAVNLVLDPLFIFGFGWGIAGAAWATVLAQWGGALAFLALLYGRDRERFAIPLAPPEPAFVGHLLRVGSVLSIRTLALVSTLTAATAVATRLGEEVVAAHQVAWQLWLMFAMFVDSLAYAAQSLVADHEGAGRPDDARDVADRLLQLGLGLGVLLGVGVWLAAPLWPIFFDLRPEVAALFATVLPIVAAMQPLNALVFIGDGIFMGARRFGWVAGAMVFSCAPTLAGLAWVLHRRLDLRAVWWCMVALILLRALSLGVRYVGPASILPRGDATPAGQAP